MPLFYQQDINETTRLGIWKIEEDETFFKESVQSHRAVTHPHKRLQHLAGRFLLKYLFPDFPFHLIQIADTRKPFLLNETYHFSISHCGDYAAAIVSSNYRVGIDIEIPSEKILKIRHKFVSENDNSVAQPHTTDDYTLIWSAKESVFKWYGYGQVDFRQHIQLCSSSKDRFNCLFSKTGEYVDIMLKSFDQLCLSYIYTRVKN